MLYEAEQTVERERRATSELKAMFSGRRHVNRIVSHSSDSRDQPNKALRQNLWVKMSDFVKGGSGLRAEGFIALVPIPKGGRERRTDAMGRCALQSWPLGRRSGRFPPLPYPPPKP